MRHLIPGLLSVLSACATLTAPTLAAQPPPDAQLVESFYGSHLPRDVRSLAAQLQHASACSAASHEVVAQLAQLDGREDRWFEELLGALADTNDDAPLLHVHQLGSVAWTQAHRQPALALMRAL